MNFMQMLAQFQQFRKDPMGMLSQKFNIPQDAKTPEDVLNHLVNSGQVSKDNLNQANQMANMLK